MEDYFANVRPSSFAPPEPLNIEPPKTTGEELVQCITKYLNGLDADPQWTLPPQQLARMIGTRGSHHIVTNLLRQLSLMAISHHKDEHTRVDMWDKCNHQITQLYNLMVDDNAKQIAYTRVITFLLSFVQGLLTTKPCTPQKHDTNQDTPDPPNLI